MSERIGPYEIVTQIGEGGMGQVYRAVDTRLDRTVAIKRLKSGFSERFEREARAISALNHPNIATLHDVGDDYLVMEYVDGKPLAGPLPLEKALEYGKQILSALEAAHRLGIVHRDLKPANILVTKAAVKLLDFGLAKVRPKASAASAEHTMTLALTGEHTIMGTPQYMAPEQIEGREADARSDIFAFGCVLYEMLTGTRAFDGKSASSVMAAVLAAEPRPLRELVPVVPERLDKVLRVCLAKDPDERWQTATDLRRELDWLTSPEAPAVVTRRKASLWVAGGAVAAGLSAVGGYLAGSRSAGTPIPSGVVRRFRLSLSGPPISGRIRIAPSGERFWYQARDRISDRINRTLYVCDFEGGTPRARAELRTTGGFSPSPDGKMAAFGGFEGLMQVSAEGGPPQLITTSPVRSTAATPSTGWRADDWTDNGLILSLPFVGDENDRTITAIPVGGGQPRPLVKLTDQTMVYAGNTLRMLPGNTHVLTLIDRGGQTWVAVQATDGSQPSFIAQGRQPLYLRSGHLMYRVGTNWRLLPFDLGSMQKAGPEVAVPGEMLPNADVDNAGTLITSDSRDYRDELRILHRNGTAGAPLATDAKRVLNQVSASPDGRSVLLAANGGADIWLLDLQRGVQTRMTFAEGEDETPVWSPDGTQFASAGAPGVDRIISIRRSDGGGSERVLYRTKLHDHVEAWSPDGRFLLVTAGSAAPGIRIVSVATGEQRPFLETKFYHRQVVFSPDGRWVAYVSDESGRREIYVRPFPEPGGKWQVSTEGGARPRWSRNGKEIVYVSDKGVMAVQVQTAPAFSAATPQLLFAQQLGEFDLLPDGRIVGFTTAESGVQEVLVITNFFERARQIAPRSS